MKWFYLGNGSYDKHLPILITLARVAEDHGGELSDDYFTCVTSEYAADEDEVMAEMARSNNPEFVRTPNGWLIK